ncbi:flagellar basal body rod protein [Virgibacillus sp. C22-A2]|uniref:Flagellar basal body rod protein n=1 Tax=Virgibacillus tibetensis TaxID=3042313 RepID=A0ABU6KIJ8_9BACI|nr:flagellar basal body rod protein [Virgibacillus sp. C22-A2]
MKKFMLFIGGLAAFFILLANLGPMILLGIGVWLLYAVFKRFMKSGSTTGKIGWFVVGLLVMSIVLSNVYAVIGVVAAYVLYVIFKNWKKETNDPVVQVTDENDDPFTNFERQWAEFNN